MKITHIRTKGLLAAAIGAAVVGIGAIGTAAAPEAVAESGGPNACDCAWNHIPVGPYDLHGNLNPPPRQQPVKLPNHPPPPGGKPHPGGV
jgi:hypothetical protein